MNQKAIDKAKKAEEVKRLYKKLLVENKQKYDETNQKL
jgi:hypothetical protein